jgi:MFS family permease
MSERTDKEAHVKFADLLTEGRALLTFTLILAVGSHATNLFVTRTVLPSIVADIGGKEMMYWALALFQITAIVGGMASAQIKTKLGGRHTIYASALLLVIGSSFAGFANHFGFLIIGRGVQGFAEGMLISLSYIILSESYKDNLLTRMIGVLAIVWAIAAAIGPLAAGLLEEHFGWRAAFLVNLIIAALLVIQSHFAVPQLSNKSDTNKVPVVRLLLFVAAITGICLTGQLQSAGQIAAVLIISCALLLFAIRKDKAANNRMLPDLIFTAKGSVGIGIWINVSVSLAVGGHAVYATAMLQSLWQLSPMQAGYIASIVAAAWSLASWALSGVSRDKHQLNLIRLGVSFITLSFPLTALGWGTTNLWITAMGFGLAGIGLGTQGVFLEKKIMQAATAPEKDRTSSILPPIDSAAGAIGAAVASILALSFGLFAGNPTFGILDAEVAARVAPQMYIAFFVLSVPAMVMTFLLPLNDSPEGTTPLTTTPLQPDTAET